MTRLMLLVGVLGAARAWACSGLECSQVVAPVPAAGSEIPSNAPAVGVQRTAFGDLMFDGGIEYRPPTSAALVLRGPDGGLVNGPAVESQLGVFVETTLTPGSWAMSLDEPVCGVDAGFTVGPAAALPTVSAALSLVETVWVPAFEGNVSCYRPYPAQQAARLRIVASQEMHPWLALARWELEVDGVNVTTSPFGRVTAQPYEPAPVLPFAFLNVFAVQCGAVPDGGTSQRFQPGLHEARVLARILGVAAPIASNTLQVDVVCSVPDAGVDLDAGVDVDAGVDAGSIADSDAGVTPDGGTGGGEASGCQPEPGPQRGCSSVGGLEVLAFGLFLLRRRTT